MFGENLTTEGVDVSGALVGERWRIGTVELEVCQPRLPCAKLGLRFGDPRMVKRFGAGRAARRLPADRARGRARGGRRGRRERKPEHDVTVALVSRRDPARRRRCSRARRRRRRCRPGWRAGCGSAPVAERRSWAGARSSLRREAGGDQRASTLELFYDLVFVFAITQVSHLLLEHLDWEGAAQSRARAARRLVGVELHDLGHERARPRLDRGPAAADRADARAAC